MPYLNNHDGIGALEKALGKCSVPGYYHALLAVTIYKLKRTTVLFDEIRKEYELGECNTKRNLLAMLRDISTDDRIISYLTEIYINTEESVLRTTALLTILHHRGLITDPNDLNELIEKRSMLQSYSSDDAAARRAMINRPTL